MEDILGACKYINFYGKFHVGTEMQNIGILANH